MLLGLTTGALLVMLLFPETSVARSLHRYLVEAPVAWLGRLERHHLLYGVVLLAVMFSFGEAVALFGSADRVFAYALDVTLYVDALIATAAVAAGSHIRASASALRARLAGMKRHGANRRLSVRSRRTRTATEKKPSSNDEEPAIQLMAA